MKPVIIKLSQLEDYIKVRSLEDRVSELDAMILRAEERHQRQQAARIHEAEVLRGELEAYSPELVELRRKAMDLTLSSIPEPGDIKFAAGHPLGG